MGRQSGQRGKSERRRQCGSASAAHARSRDFATWRAILIALLMMPFQSWWIVRMEVIQCNTWPTMLSLPLHTLFLVLVLVAGNLLLRRRARRLALSQGELLTVYLMLAISGVIVGYGLLQQLVSWVIVPMGKATPQNDWEQLFSRYLPNWLVLTNREALYAVYYGESSFLTAQQLRAWAMPIVSWSAFFLAFFAAMLSLNVLVRRRWIDEERLTFPLVQVPLAVTDPSADLFRGRLLWVGFGLTMLLGIMNGLHTLFPAVPSFQPNLGHFNQSLGLQWPCFLKYGGTFWPPYGWAVGVAFLMPLDISFSYWFFFWFVKIEEWLTLIWGWDIAPDAPFAHLQSAAGLIGIGVYVLWSGRRHLGRALRQALGREGLDERNEPLSYRSAFAMLVLSVCFLGVFLWYAGAALWLVPVYLGLYLTATLALSRMRAELGAPANEVHDAEPYRIVTQIAPSGAIPFRSLTVLALFSWTARYGMDPTPLQIEGFKMGERTGLRTRGLVGAMFIAAAAGLVFGYFALLIPLHHLGADSSKLQLDTMSSVQAFSELATWLSGTPPPSGVRSLAIGGGLAFTFFLYAMRGGFLWWPFHPIGYVLAPMWFTHHLWMSIFIAWIIKFVLLRYGGLRAYVRALPFFLGLILGDCVIGSMWALVNLVFHVPTFGVWM